MASDPDLFDFASGPHSHRHAPETSAKAATTFKARHGTMRALVHDFALRRADYGFTDEDLWTSCYGYDRQKFERSIRPRRTELANERWLLDSGRRQKVDGNECVVWIHRRFHADPPPIQPKGRPEAKRTAGDERARICKWLKDRVAAGWPSELLLAAAQIEVGNHWND